MSKYLDEKISLSVDRRITITNQKGYTSMSDDNIKRLSKSYCHPFEVIPEVFYKEKNKSARNT